MKTISSYLCLIAMLALVFTSCSKDESTVSEDSSDKASLSFGAIVNDLASKSGNKQTTTAELPVCKDETAAYVEVVLSQGGTPVVGTTDDPLRVNLVAGQVFTEETSELELEPGTYSLDYFKVYSAADELIWIAPRGGELANFVDDPLPMSINLGAGVKKYVDVPVLCYDDRDVNEYGYQFFDVDTNEAIEFCIFGNYCPPAGGGRHYPAEYSVSVWSGTSANGTPLYTNVTNETGEYENGDFYADPLCFALPDKEGVDNYYLEVTLRSSDEYGTVTEEVIKTAQITDEVVKTFFDGENNLDYAHFREGCEEDSNPVFQDPDSEADSYKTCAYPMNGSKSAALATFEVLGNTLKATVIGAKFTPNQVHQQHIHGLDNGDNSTCPPMEADENGDGLITMEEGLPYYGGVKLALDNEDGSFPTTNGQGVYIYQRTFDITGMDFSWEDLSLVVHGLNVDGTYEGALPAACGEVSNLY